MENFESLNAIAEEFKIKESTLALFELDLLLRQGKAYHNASHTRPRFLDTAAPFEVVYDTHEASFCSIFLDSVFSEPTASAQPTNTELMLRSDIEVLSSEYDPGLPPVILTSEQDPRGTHA